MGRSENQVESIRSVVFKLWFTKTPLGFYIMFARVIKHLLSICFLKHVFNYL